MDNLIGSSIFLLANEFVLTRRIFSFAARTRITFPMILVNHVKRPARSIQFRSAAIEKGRLNQPRQKLREKRFWQRELHPDGDRATSSWIVSQNKWEIRTKRLTRWQKVVEKHEERLLEQRVVTSSDMKRNALHVAREARWIEQKERYCVIIFSRWWQYIYSNNIVLLTL